ncbi:MAG: hypothetical protein ACTSQB_02385 [Candidatus Heimdallarchaeota archaeon]
MNRKLLRFTIILTSLLALTFIVQPNVARTSAEAGRLLVFDRLGPSETIFHNDIVFFGGTVFNNDTSYTYLLIDLEVEIYHEFNATKNLRLYPLYYFSSLVSRNTIEPMESRTFAFEQEISTEWPVAENYTVVLSLHFKNVDDMGDETIQPYERWLGNTSVNVDIHRVDAPNYIYAVFVLLLVGILSFIIIGLVGWIRERRAKQ